MEGTRRLLLQSLEQHGFRTGTEIGAALGMSRAAIHKHVQALVKQGVPIHRVPGRGYRLAEGVKFLSEKAIVEPLSKRTRALLNVVEVLDEVDSTTAYLQRSAEGTGSLNGCVCLAERQSAGRGRRGRSWIASPYRDLTMSIGIEYPQWPAELPTLGLVAALIVSAALQKLGAGGLAMKWPNDVMQGDRKLCGILLDVTGEAHGPCRVIVGIGVNVSMNSDQGAQIDQRWIDLESLIGAAPDRNTIAAQCLDGLLPAFHSFPVQGFSGYCEKWRDLDALKDRSISIHCADGSTQEGTAVGVDESGRLKVIDAQGMTRVFTQGDVSVRAR